MHTNNISAQVVVCSLLNFTSLYSRKAALNCSQPAKNLSIFTCTVQWKMHTHVPCKQKSVLKQKAPEENWVNNYTAMDKRRQIPQWVVGQDLAVRSSMQEGNKEADFGRMWKYGPILTTWILFGHLLCWAGHPWCKSHTEGDLDHVLPTPRVGPILGAQLHMCTVSLDSTGLQSLPQIS